MALYYVEARPWLAAEATEHWSAAGQRLSGLRRPNVSALNVNGLAPATHTARQRNSR